MLKELGRRDVRHRSFFLLRNKPENLIQLISILFDNAVKYASEGGYIDVSLKKSGRELVLQVKNTCEKLPEVEPEKLFERFLPGDAARTQKSGGYGIGLRGEGGALGTWGHTWRVL